jgi:hypothetical protein
MRPECHTADRRVAGASGMSRIAEHLEGHNYEVVKSIERAGNFRRPYD